MRLKLPSLLFCVLIINCIPAFVNAQSTLVKIGTNGKLEYFPYSNTGETNAVNYLPDFSYAGYKFGGVALPNVPVVITLTPIAGDNLAQIQNAISTVSAMPLNVNGFRGAILFKAGKYEVSAPFKIQASGIVLRGEGQKPADQGGTELYSSSPTQHDFITFTGTKTSSSSGFLVDTIIVPQKNTVSDGKLWLNCNVKSAVELEYSGDKTVSLHLYADNTDFTGYESKENASNNKPYILLKLFLTNKEKDTLITLYPTDDAYIQGGATATVNYGTDNNLVVKNAGVNSSTTREIFLKFALPNYNAEIIAADLFMYCSNAGDNTNQKNFVELISNDNWQENTITYANQPIQKANIRISQAYVPVGTRTFTVADASTFKAGDKIIILRTPNDNWINTLNMAQYGWTASAYRVEYERTITAVNGNQITIDIPFAQAIIDIYGGGEIYLNPVAERTNNCGIENMFLTSYYAYDTDELHGWVAVSFGSVQDCWAKNVTARYFGYGCVEINTGFRITVQECAMLDPKSITDGGRKYSFNIEKGSFNLFQRCYSRGGRHDFATGSQVAGPNVFLDGFSEETYADIGPHHRYATGILFDNLKGGQIRVQNRKDMGTGHGWAGAQTMFWNLESVKEDIKVESPIGAMNWGIGCKGVLQQGAGYWESWGTHLLPRSLYLKQLEDRLGTDAVLKTTSADQRAGNMYSKLSAWKGIGTLTPESPTGMTGFKDYKALVYPNPTTNLLYVEIQSSVEKSRTITIYNSLSYKVLSTKSSLPNFNINLEKLNAGIYFIQISEDGKKVFGSSFVKN